MLRMLPNFSQNEPFLKKYRGNKKRSDKIKRIQVKLKVRKRNLKESLNLIFLINTCAPIKIAIDHTTLQFLSICI